MTARLCRTESSVYTTGSLKIFTNNCISNKANVQYAIRNERIPGYVFNFLRLNHKEIENLNRPHNSLSLNKGFSVIHKEITMVLLLFLWGKYIKVI